MFKNRRQSGAIAFQSASHFQGNCTMNRWYLRLMLVCLFMYPSMLAAAETAPLSMSEAVHLADKQNPKISAAISGVSAAEHKITQAISGYLPQVNFTETYGHTTNPMWAFGTRLNQKIITQQDFDPDRLNHPNAIDNFNSAVSVEWPVYHGGQIQIGLEQAKWNKSAQELFLSRTRQEVTAQTATAYTDALMTQRQLDVIQKALETAQKHLTMIQTRYQSGLVVKSDVLRTEVHIADLEQKQIQAQSHIAIAMAVLNATMGEAGGNQWQLTTSLEKGPSIATPLKDWIDLAESNRPDMRNMAIQEQLAEADVKKAKGAHLPQVNLMGNYEVNSQDFRNSGDNYTIGAMMRINIYSGDRLSAQTQEAEAMHSKVQAMRSELASGIEVQTRQAFLEAQSAWNRIQVSETAVAQANENLKIVRDRYENGLLTLVSLLDAEVASQYAETNRYKALHDYTVARIQLLLAAGALDTDFK